jgi:hypothetical protein
MKSGARLWFALGVIAGSLTLGGCVYLRLLQFKSQLADFERYFSTDARDGITITCQQPVVRDEDIEHFLQLAPETRQRVGSTERWFLRWRKEPAAGDDRPYEITADLVFVDHRLAKIILPESLFVGLPKAGFLAAMRSMGHATLDEKSRSALAQITDQPGNGDAADTLFPTQAQLRAMLGAPVEIITNPAGPELRYRLNAVSPTQHFGRIDLSIAFDSATGRMRRVRGVLLFGNVELTISEPPAGAGSPARAQVAAEK